MKNGGSLSKRLISAIKKAPFYRGHLLAEENKTIEIF